MAVQFVLGRAGAGKTRWCLDAIAGELARAADGPPLVLLVPEQASFQMERAQAMLAAGHGFVRARVLSFSRLAQQVLERGPRTLPMLSRAARELALRAVLHPLASELPLLAGAAKTPGFIAGLDQFIETLLTEQVSPGALDEAAVRLADATGRQKLRELSRIYGAYRAWLAPRAVDPAERLELLCAQIANTAWLREATIWVDGFAGFTGQEFATLAELGRVTRGVYITLLTDPERSAATPGAEGNDHELFARTEQTRERLEQRLATRHVELGLPLRLCPPILPRFRGVVDLQQLEARFCADGETTDRFGNATTRAGTAEGTASERRAVRLLQCETHRDELEQAARFIRERVVTGAGTVRFRDFAVIARDLQPFAGLVAEVFGAYDIPFFLDQRRGLIHHPLTRFVQAALGAAAGDCPTTGMVALLRNELAPLERADAAQIENVAVGQGLRGRTWWQRPRWERRADQPAIALPRGGPPAATGPLLDLDAARLRLSLALDPLFDAGDMLTRAGRAATGAEWATALHGFLDRCGVMQRLAAWIAEAQGARRWEAAQTHSQAWAAVGELLDDLHQLLGDMPLGIADIQAIVGAALRDRTLGLAPPAVDQVLVSAIERSRHPDLKYAWLFAFNERIFPQPPREQPLLTREECAALSGAGIGGVPVADEEAMNERLLAYVALTRPAHDLTVSYANIGLGGEAQLPSPLLEEIRRALPGLEVERPAGDRPPSTLTELADQLLDRKRSADAPARAASLRVLETELHGTPQIGPKLASMLRGRGYSNAAVDVGNFRLPTAGDRNLVWSGAPTELEAYLRCPWKHFATYGLRLKRPAGRGPSERAVGELVHDLLAVVMQRARREANPPESCVQFNDERWRGLAAATIGELQNMQMPEFAQDHPNLAFFVNEVLPARLEELVFVQANRWRHGGFYPVAIEQSFGTGDHGAWPAAYIELDGGDEGRLRGTLDRLDEARADGNTWAMVYDYKPVARFSKGEPYLIGPPLQALAYLWAVLQLRGGVRPAGVLLAPHQPQLSAIDTAFYRKATSKTAQTLFLYEPRGLISDQAVPLLDHETTKGRSPVVAVEYKVKGGLTAKSDAVADATLRARVGQALETVQLGIGGIAKGLVEAAPLVQKKTLACLHCDFRTVCRFDRTQNRVRAAEEALPVRAEPDPATPEGAHEPDR